VGEEGFPYPNPIVGSFCEQAARRIEAANLARVRMSVAARLEIGQQLNEVERVLPHGQFEAWLRWRFPGWSLEAVRRWRVMAQRAGYCQNPKFLDSLHKFQSTTAAEQFFSLEEHVQALVVEKEAWTWSAFRAVVWRAGMDAHLADEGLPFAARHGDVLHAIEEARDDPALADEARALYEENRETFARLSDREPSEVDAEVGVEPSPPPPSPGVRGQLFEEERYWLCERQGDEFVPVAPVRQYVLLWPDAEVAVAFPKVDGGAGNRAFQLGFMDAGCKALSVATIKMLYGEAV
jgi:hypothetical protein